MLDDEEWAFVQAAHHASKDSRSALALIEEERVRLGRPPLTPLPQDAGGIERRLHHITAGYELFTGMAESNPNAVWHHVASLYGPPCAECGKPLRTPKASFCAACGRAVG